MKTKGSKARRLLLIAKIEEIVWRLEKQPPESSRSFIFEAKSLLALVHDGSITDVKAYDAALIRLGEAL